MDLHNLKPANGSTHRQRRIGRGQGSGKGGTSTRGHKGAQSRSGYSRKIGFEGGQMPIYRILPKRGFKNINRVEYNAINVSTLQKLAEKNITDARAAIEERKLDRERIADRILIREEDLKAKQEELATIVESTAKEEKALQAKRAACAAKIDERTLSAYERIRGNAHNHLAVVTLFPKNEDGTYGDACGGCFHTITPQRIIDIASGKKLVICEHCGRIIVNPDI